MDFSLIDAIARAMIWKTDFACCTDSGSIAVWFRLKAELGLLVVDRRDAEHPYLALAGGALTFALLVARGNRPQSDCLTTLYISAKYAV